MRILFTGGSGKAGKHAVRYLVEAGHRVLNVDLRPFDLDGVETRHVDLTDAGQVMDTVLNYAALDELDLPEKPSFDASPKARRGPTTSPSTRITRRSPTTAMPCQRW